MVEIERRWRLLPHVGEVHLDDEEGAGGDGNEGPALGAC